MTRRLSFVKSYRDRHDRARHYFRKPGAASIPLPGEYGSKEFMEAYWAALEDAPKRDIGAAQERAGSFGALIALYYKSKAYRSLKEITQRTYRNALERFRKDHGDKLVKGFRERHVVAILEAGDGRQDNLRKVLRLILKLAKEKGWIDVHPMAEMRRPRKGKGFRAWTEEDIAQFKAHWPSGSRERLALALLLCTTQRRSDARLIGRQHVQGDQIRVTQQKGGTELLIPIHPELKAEMDLAQRDHLTFLVTQYGEPYSAAGFTNWFSEKAREAGLPPGSTPHGLRKAGARRLAEAGCTPHQIMAVTGHKNLSEVTLYTQAADQARLAREAMGKVEPRTEVSNPEGPVRQSGGKVE